MGQDRLKIGPKWAKMVPSFIKTVKINENHTAFRAEHPERVEHQAVVWMTESAL